MHLCFMCSPRFHITLMMVYWLGRWGVRWFYFPTLKYWSLFYQLCLKFIVPCLYHLSSYIWPHDTKRSQLAFQCSPWKHPQADPTVHTSFQITTGNVLANFLPLKNAGCLFSASDYFPQDFVISGSSLFETILDFFSHPPVPNSMSHVLRSFINYYYSHTVLIILMSRAYIFKNPQN